MALHHHIKHAKHLHHHLRRAGHRFLLAAAKHHPILTTALALVGGGTLIYKAVGTKTPTTAQASEPASAVVS